MGTLGNTGNAVEAPPTAVRYELLGMVTIMSVLLYLDRFCIQITEEYFQKEFELSRFQMGLVYSAFFFSYALAQVPTSWLGDRIGPRWMLGGCVLAWSLLTGGIGLVGGLASLLVVRMLMGISQAAAYPMAGRINSVWVPNRMRALGNGLVTMGGRGGAALAPFLTARLILLNHGGWRPVFWAYALVGLAWSGYFFLRFRNTPQEHPQCNAAEVEEIIAGRPPETRARSVAVPWMIALCSFGLWLQCLTQFASNISWTFLGTWLPTYLRETYEIDLAMRGLLTSLPSLAGMFGCVLGGVVADRLTRRLGLRWGRNLLGIGSKFLAAFFMLLSAWAGDAVLATIALALASFVNDLGISVTWAYLQDAGGRYVAPLLGFSNMFGNLGAMVSPLLLGELRDQFGWGAALYACSFFFLLASVCWFGMDARVPIVPERSES